MRQRIHLFFVKKTHRAAAFIAVGASPRNKNAVPPNAPHRGAAFITVCISPWNLAH